MAVLIVLLILTGLVLKDQLLHRNVTTVEMESGKSMSNVTIMLKFQEMAAAQLVRRNMGFHVQQPIHLSVQLFVEMGSRRIKNNVMMGT